MSYVPMGATPIPLQRPGHYSAGRCRGATPIAIIGIAVLGTSDVRIHVETRESRISRGEMACDTKRRRSVASEYAFAPGELEALLAAPFDPSNARRLDELIQCLEDDDGTARLVPDWSDASYQNAA